MLRFQKLVSTTAEIFMHFLNSPKIFEVQLHDWMNILNSKLQHNIILRPTNVSLACTIVLTGPTEV